MLRLRITIPKTVYNRLFSIALQSNNSMSNTINQLIGLGMHCMDDNQPKQNQQSKQVEQHCHQLIIQINALIKNMSAEVLKFNQEDFEKLRYASLAKYNELIKVNITNLD